MKPAVTAFILLICVVSAVAAPFPETDVPEILQPWIKWVTHGEIDESCPLVYNDLSRTICDWPSPLQLNVKERRADFSQTWTIHGPDTWIDLPGDNRFWPQAVTVDGREYPVGNRQGRPAIFLAVPGKYQIRGGFDYDQIPEWLQVPVHTGRVQLRIAGQAVDFPRLERDGRLWLSREESAIEEKQPEDRLQVQVHRLVEDDIPLRLTTRLDLVVSGRHRHVRLGEAGTGNFIPMRLNSPLPARIESDGTLLMQVRPGRWAVEITARHVGPTNELSLDTAGRFESDHEIWAFAARRHLRLVTVQGPPQIDSRQTSMPDKWAHLPAYLMKSDTVMQLEEQLRGDPEPEPDRINLDRSLWLDFDGRGYSARDRITGTMTTGWRLEAGPPILLGRVSIDGQKRLITRLEDSAGVGVEIRHGRLDLVAESRIDSSRTLPATGWNRDFQSVKGTLNLPPGWTLLAASGIDNIRQTWLKQWSLLNLFLVLVIAVAAARLYRWYWGLTALVVMVLITHEPGAPAWIWLHLLAAVALVRVVPEGKIRVFLNSYRLGCVVVLLVISLPFMVVQVRNGLYPQMERSWRSVDGTQARPDLAEMVSGRLRLEAAMPQAAAPRMLMAETDAEKSAETRKTAKVMGLPAPEADRTLQVERFDVDAKVQTGPGLPDWQWRQVPFSWNGPVGEEESMTFVLLSPGINLALALTRTVLLALLIWGLSGIRFSGKRRADLNKTFSRASPALSLPVLLAATAIAAGLLPPSVSAAQPVFPPESFLTELKERLTEKEPPACAPDCATSPRMNAVISDNRLTIHMEVHSLYDPIAVPLPASINQWVPQTVRVNDQPLDNLYHDPATGRIWLSLAEGIHRLVLSGDLPPMNTVQLPLPLKPRHVTATVEGWTVDGLHANGRADDQLQFDRVRRETGEAEPVAEIEPERLPPLLEITRVFHLGLTWHIETTARRQTPPGSAVVVAVPLLPGESVTSEIPVADGRVLLNMGPGQRQISWLSELDKTDQLKLQAADTREWTEVWKIDVAPVWHTDFEGIPVIQHQDRQGNRLPEWRPWPGEKVHIHISRPQGVEGRTLTVEQSRLTARPGPRLTDTELELEITSSRGSQHEILLPEKAELQSVTINGRAQPVRQEDRSVTLPLTPGKQEIRMTWRQQLPMARHWQTPRVDLRIPGVNAFTTVHMPQNRWVLFCDGPRLGPAVLFWSLVLVIALLALGLGQISVTPLRFQHWFLLGLGLTQASLLMALPVAAWFLALGYRRKIVEKLSGGLSFNLLQLLLLGLTAAAAAALLSGIKHGLLGYPDMHIAGNGSTNYLLHWYQDRADAILPRAGVISLPLMVYRILILAWALWLAFACIRWLRWGWACWSADGWWRPVRFRRAGTGPAPSGQGSHSPDKSPDQSPDKSGSE